MKKALILASLCAVVVFSSCGSKKGKWNDKDKKAFSEKCVADAKTKGKMDDAKAKAFCDCALPKAEAVSDNAKAFDGDAAAQQPIMEGCVTAK